MKPSKIDPPICIALDKASLADALPIIDAFAERVPVFKIGFELFCACGPAAVEAVHARGRDVFLDLKINDIPNTAAGAVRSAARLGAAFLTIHGNGGRAMIRAAVEAAVEAAVDEGLDAAGGRAPHLLVVSALTSLDEQALLETGVTRTVAEQVDAMATLAVAEGAPGLTLAAGEVARVRATYPDLFLLVPGIRPTWAGAKVGDQKRVGTPAAAVADGADLIVLGRAVTAADDPVTAIERVLDEIAHREVSA